MGKGLESRESQVSKDTADEWVGVCTAQEHLAIRGYKAVNTEGF